jgi:hypothetical protein
VLIALLAACSEGPTVANTPPRTASLCAPFLGWELPVQGATVVYCDERRLELHYPTGRADQVGPLYRLAVRTGGWVEDLDSTAQGLVNVRYTQDGEVLDLSAIDGVEHTSVILTRLRPAPAPAPVGDAP